MRAKITKRLVDGLKPAEKQYWVWDTEQRGFGLRVLPSATMIYAVTYRNEKGAQRWQTIGHAGTLTPDQARSEALKALADAERGLDPGAKKGPEMTVKELSAEFLTYIAEHRKPNTLDFYKGILEKHILPVMGRKPLSDVTRADVARLHSRVGKTWRIRANRVAACLSSMYGYAQRMGYAENNPAVKVGKFKEQQRRRYMTPDELQRLTAAINDAEEKKLAWPGALTAIKLLLATGARRREITNLRWADIDFARHVIVLADSKTGQKEIRLNSLGMAILDKTPRACEWVCPGRRHDGPLAEIKSVWARLLKEAKITNLKPHDMRHAFASIAVGAGLSLYQVGGLLGHKVAQTTSRYAHLAGDVLSASAEIVGREMERMMNGETGAEIIAINPAPVAKVKTEAAGA